MTDQPTYEDSQDDDEDSPIVLASRVYDRNRHFANLPTNDDDESAKIRR